MKNNKIIFPIAAFIIISAMACSGFGIESGTGVEGVAGSGDAAPINSSNTATSSTTIVPSDSANNMNSITDTFNRNTTIDTIHH